ncbi:MAG: PGN_0703 family putative restriction endonuclease [Ilumatobacteraceae bacterium]
MPAHTRESASDDRPPDIEPTDVVPGQPDLTAWRQAARRHQATYRVAHGWPAGRTRRNRRGPAEWRPIGSRVDLDYATAHACNFLGSDIVDAVRHRLQPSNRQPHQTLDETRLWCDLLSSMPMCFNLFGSLWGQPERAASVVERWFPEMMLPAATVTVHFEWSPGRRDPEWLGDRTAFDVMIEIATVGSRHLIGIETKYHEAPATPARRTKEAAALAPHRSTAAARYREVAAAAAMFRDPAEVDRITSKKVEQVWRDHLLALACHQHAKGWDRVQHVLVAPSGNPAWGPLVDEYRSLLTPKAAETVEYRTVEQLLDSAGSALPHAHEFRTRYLVPQGG